MYGLTTLPMMMRLLQFILDERARELYHEGYRRTDLIRFGEFTTSKYIWQWKGGTHDGQAVDSKYNIYPIPKHRAYRQIQIFITTTIK